MKAVLIKEKGDIAGTEIADVPKPAGEVVINVAYAGLNPVDINTIRGKVNYTISPYPHIPGAEFVGIVENAGKSKRFRRGDRVMIYPRFYDGDCDRCRAGMEEICRNGGIIGVRANGGYAEFFAASENLIEKVPDSLDLKDAVSIPVGGLTSYHALKRAELKKEEKVLVVGASGNTGQYAVLLSALMGAKVYYVSRKGWLREMGGSEWKNEKVDVIVNSLGAETWDRYIGYLDSNGRIVTFGSMTGPEAKLNLAYIYTSEISIIGSTGGTRSEFRELIDIIASNGLKTRISKIYDLEDFKKAIDEYEQKNGRVILKVSGEES
jgi:alcohol dehydrogenase